MKASELRAKSVDELNKELLDLLKAQFGLRMQVATQQLSNFSQIGKVRRDIARLAVDSHVLQLKSWRALTHALRGGPPGPEGSATKLHWSESHQKLLTLATELLGERALAGPSPQGTDKAAAAWVRDALWTRAETILAGTSEVQRNILAEQMLKLPKG